MTENRVEQIRLKKKTNVNKKSSKTITCFFL